MRLASPVRTREENEESAFVSMTDMTVGFLFIIMLLLAFFASQYTEDAVPQSTYIQMVEAHDSTTEKLTILQTELVILQTELNIAKDELEATNDQNRVLDENITHLQAEIAILQALLTDSQKINPLEKYLADSAEERRRILETLQRWLRVDFPHLQVVINQEFDALRFEGDGLFRSGASELRADRREIVERVATRLEQILPCYTLGSAAAWSMECNPGGAIIEAVQIEGHTDTDGSEINNLFLATARANTTFIIMTEKEPGLIKHKNLLGQPVLSVAGYGEMRPVTTNETLEGKATNRRIDLRVIMYTPSRLEEIEKITTSLMKHLDQRVDR